MGVGSDMLWDWTAAPLDASAAGAVCVSPTGDAAPDAGSGADVPHAKTNEPMTIASKAGNHALLKKMVGAFSIWITRYLPPCIFL